MLMDAAVPLSFSVWMTLLDKFAINQVQFAGQEIGILQSLREILGLMAFLMVFVLLLAKEQHLAYISLILFGLGTLVTGWFSLAWDLYINTILLSIGFHDFETMQTSLSLQRLDKASVPHVLGKIIAAGSFTSLLIYALLAMATKGWALDCRVIYVVGGGLTVLIAMHCWWVSLRVPAKVGQHKKIVLRKRYWLYYLLVIMLGVSAQVFIVFVGFMMVEEFGYRAGDISILFLINASLIIFMAPKIGRLIGNIGERYALIFEYCGLIIIFSAYALVSNHQIAAVSLLAVLGLVWIQSHSTAFLIGAGMAFTSLMLSFREPRYVKQGREFMGGFGRPLEVAG